MNDLTITITELKTKTEKLVALHRQLKNENELLWNENKKLQSTTEEQKNIIISLEQEKQQLIHHKSEEQNKIIEDSKQKINELVQEIDDCIALLK